MLLTLIPNLRDIANAILAVAVRLIRGRAAIRRHDELSTRRTVVAMALLDVGTVGAAPDFREVRFHDCFEGRCGSADDGWGCVRMG